LDVLVTRKEDGTMGHQVFRKKTHTDSYFHVESYHHPTQNFGVLNTLVVRALRISDEEHLEDEISHLTSIFLGIGYKEGEIRKVINRAKSVVVSKNRQDPQENIARVFLPYIKGVIDNISKVLGRSDIFAQFSAARTIRQNMCSVKDSISQGQLKGVYKIDCSCGKSYIGKTRHSLQKRLKENGASIKHERCRTSALAKFFSKTKHHLCLEDAKLIMKEEHYHRRKIREALEIMKHPHNINRDG